MSKAANTAFKDEAAVIEEPQGVLSKSIEVRGAKMVITDPANPEQVWTVPADETLDSYDIHQSPFKISQYPGHNPDFRYEYHTLEECRDMLTRGWVKVSRKELGMEMLPQTAVPGDVEYGRPQTDWHQVGTQFLIKKPMVIVRREQMAFKRYADEIAGQVRPANDPTKGVVVDQVHSNSSFKEPA